MATTRPQATAADLEQLADSECRYDLIRGELFEMPPAGGEHGEIAAGIIGRLWSHVQAHRLGRVYSSETGFLLARDPDVVLAPDAAYIESSRVPERGPGFYGLAPDLVVEIASPSNLSGRLHTKVLEYLNAGVRAVWIVYPDSQTITVYYADRSARLLTIDDTLDGGDVLPGFSVPVAEIFA